MGSGFEAGRLPYASGVDVAVPVSPSAVDHSDLRTRDRQRAGRDRGGHRGLGGVVLRPASAAAPASRARAREGGPPRPAGGAGVRSRVPGGRRRRRGGDRDRLGHLLVVGQRAGQQPVPGPGHSALAAGARLHAHRPVRPSDLAVGVPRQGRDPRFQRLRVHDDLPADDDRDGRREGAAGRRRVESAAAGDRRQPGCDLGPRRALVFGAARDAARLALHDWLGRASQAGLAPVRDLGRDRARAGRSHAGAVRDRSAGAPAQAVPDPAVVRRSRSTGPAAGTGGVDAAPGPPAYPLPPLLRPRAADQADAERIVGSSRRRDGRPQARHERI